MMNPSKNNNFILTQVSQQDSSTIKSGEHTTGSISVLILILGIAGILTFSIIAILLKKFYKRSSKTLSFVRTGLGGEKVIQDSGSWVFPSLHEIIPVNMNTLRLEINRKNEQALITKDLLRINIQADFYVRVKSDKKAIKDAAQTLGEKTLNLEELKNILEGKLVSVLSVVTSEVEMNELHENRATFVDNLKDKLKEEISKNGLELETVSLTSFNQTNPQYFDPQNALDAKGLAILTKEIEEKRQERNLYEKKAEIEIHQENQDAELKMQRKILEIEREKLNLQKQEEIERLDQESELSEKRMEVNQKREQRQQKLEEESIRSQQELEILKIESEKSIVKSKNEKELFIKKFELENIQSLELIEIDNKKVIELKRQEQIIEIANKSCEQSQAQAELFISQANTVVEEEKVITAKEQAQVEREKKLALIKIEEEARSKVLLAESDAETIKLLAKAEQERYEVDATGKRSLHEANNELSQEQIALQIKMAIIEHLPEIIRESVKPMEKIEGIRIYQLEGLNGNITSSTSNNNSNEGVSENGNLVDDMISGALRYRVQAPLVDSVMKEIGLSGDTLESLTKPIHKVD